LCPLFLGLDWSRSVRLLSSKPRFQLEFFSSFCLPPGLGSSWLKHALKERPPTALIGVARAVVVLVLERVFVVGGEVAAATRVLAGRGGQGPRPDLGGDQPGDGPSRDAPLARGSGRAAG
jgi:hypothetical protein